MAEVASEFAKLASVGTDMDVGHHDAALLGRRIWRDGGKRPPSATARMAVLAPPGEEDGGGYSPPWL